MLSVTINDIELWDDQKEEFIAVKGQTLQLEHSLISISKWESKWEKPFLTKHEKTREEQIDYIKCMTINKVDDLIFDYIPDDIMKQINEYIAKPMTAAWFREDNKSPSSSEQPTNELIYYWMIGLNIPFECEKWHLNRLLTLIKVCNAKNKPAEKMSRDEILRRNAQLNAKRRAAVHSKG